MSVSEVELPAPPVGVIESLATGFETVAERLSLVLLPLLLDLFLWTGPRMFAQPAFESFYSNVIVPVAAQQPAELQEQWGPLTEQFETLAADLAPIYLPVARWRQGGVLLLGMPSLVEGQPVSPLPFNFEPPLWEVRSFLNVLALSLLLPMAGNIFGIAYRGMVAQQVQEKQLRLFQLLRRMPVYWLNLIGFMIFLIILFVVIMTPFVIIGGVLSLVGPSIGLLAVTAGVFVMMWLAIFASFTVHSVLMHGRWALAALWDSVRVVQWNLSSTALLWLTVVGLSLGLTYVFEWAGLTTATWFVVLAIGVHAFVNTALITATFVYFKDRYRHWSEMRTLLLERLNQASEQGRQPVGDIPQNQ